MSLETWLAYVASVSVLVLLPGPSVLLAATRALEHGTGKSLATVAGDLSANALQMLAAGAGLGVLVAGSPAALETVRWLGVAYLAFLGARLSCAPAAAGARGLSGSGDGPSRTTRGLYLEGFGVSIANPKAVVFFAALFPAFLADDASIGRQLLILGLTFVALDASALTLWASAARRLRRIQPGVGVARLGGALLLVASLGLALK